jgi:Zn ribbon nucleic-acid-binding protein
MDGRRCPKCGALIDHLDYWERAINTGECWQDGFHNVIASDVYEHYFLCLECGKVLFNDIEAAKKFPERPAHNGGRYMPLGLLAPA